MLQAVVDWARAPDYRRCAGVLRADNHRRAAHHRSMGFVEEGRRLGEFRNRTDGTLSKDDVQMMLWVKDLRSRAAGASASGSNASARTQRPLSRRTGVVRAGADRAVGRRRATREHHPELLVLAIETSNPILGCAVGLQSDEPPGGVQGITSGRGRGPRARVPSGVRLLAHEPVRPVAHQRGGWRQSETGARAGSSGAGGTRGPGDTLFPALAGCSNAPDDRPGNSTA